MEVHITKLWRYSLVGKDTHLSKWAIYLTKVRFPKADFGHLGHEGKRNAAWGLKLLISLVAIGGFIWRFTKLRYGAIV